MPSLTLRRLVTCSLCFILSFGLIGFQHVSDTMIYRFWQPVTEVSPAAVLAQIPDLPAIQTQILAPRLFLTPDRIQQLQEAIRIPNSHFQQAFAALKARVDQNDWRLYDSNPKDDNWNYARSWLAREAAFLYQITGEATYAQIAYQNLEAIYTDPDPDQRVMESGYGLARAMIGLGFAITDDWASRGWTAEQQQWVRGKLLQALDAWPSYKHANLNEPWGSNWVAVCRGAELIMILATHEEKARHDRLELLKWQLQQHLQTAYGPTGFTQEGNGYLAYSGGFLIPAVYALRDIGDTSLDVTFNAKAFWKLALYSGTFGAEQAALQFGVGGPNFDPEGWTSLLLASVPPEQLPYYQFFYDRHRGIHNPAPPAQKFDHLRAGTTWALIYYPFTSVAIDPTGRIPPVLADEEKGAYFFRNRWQDSNDTLISFMGDFKSYPRAWNQAEAFSLGLFAYGSRFIGGPGLGRQPRYFSRLLVDGQPGQGATGKPDRFEPNEQGGYVIVDGGETYDRLGLIQTKRHLLVNFAPDGSSLLSTLDQITDESTHLYTWQLNLGNQSNPAEVQITRGQEAGLTTFLITTDNTSFVKGWVISPSNAIISRDDPLRINALGRNLNFWVVMWVGQGKPPLFSKIGRDTRAELTLGQLQLRYDQAQNRIKLN